MKLLACFAFLAAVCVVCAAKDLHPRGCIYVEGQCFEECGEGTHAYTTGCDYVTPEPTCDEPHPKPNMRDGQVCDFTDCYCDSPTVRHPKTKKCVRLDECENHKNNHNTTST